MNKKSRFQWTTLLWLALLAALLYWALRGAPLIDIWQSLKQLTLFQIIILLALHAVYMVFITLRWWIIVRAEQKQIPFWPLVGYRLSAFGLSYYTPGPQVGGEPLQIIFLQRHGVTYARATAAVIMDKLLEFLANFLFMAVGLFAIFQVGMVSLNGLQTAGSLIPLAALMAWPAVHITALHRGRLPLTAVLRAAFSRFSKNKLYRLIVLAEHLAARFTQRHLSALTGALGASFLFWIANVTAYLLMLNFLHMPLMFWQAIAALTLAWLSFLIPLPAGLGALEASQVFALGALGYSAAQAISLSLIMRGRDMLFGALGLLLAAKPYNKSHTKR